MATTPEEWLPILTKSLDDRYPRVALLRGYANGEARLPEMGKNLAASWKAFQKKARTNLGGLAVGSLGDRLRPNGIQIGSDSKAPALAAARRIWRDNRMDVQVSDAINDYLETGNGYLVAGAEAATAVISREKPEDFYAKPHPLRPWKAVAAVKVWRDTDLGIDLARVWAPGADQLFWRATKTTSGTVRTGAAGDDWEPYSEPTPYLGDPPVIILERKNGQGLVEPHLDVIDRINLGKLQRLVITALQAFAQRALKSTGTADGVEGGLPTEDADGNSIDYARTFEPGPGALWELPEGIDIWESQQTDIRPLLDGEKADARDFAAVTRTPISVFIPDGANQSAEGAANAKEGQVFQAKDEIARLGPGLAVLIVYALRAEGIELEGETVEILWTPPEHVSLSEKYAAAAQAKAAGIARKTILRDILGYSPDQIDQDALDLAEEQLATFALIGGNGGDPAA